MVILKFKKSNTFGKFIGVYLHLKENNSQYMEMEDHKKIYKEIVNYKYEEHTNLAPKHIKELLYIFPVAARYFLMKPESELERVLLEWYK